MVVCRVYVLALECMEVFVLCYYGRGSDLLIPAQEWIWILFFGTSEKTQKKRTIFLLSVARFSFFPIKKASSWKEMKVKKFSADRGACDRNVRVMRDRHHTWDSLTHKCTLSSTPRRPLSFSNCTRRPTVGCHFMSAAEKTAVQFGVKKEKIQSLHFIFLKWNNIREQKKLREARHYIFASALLARISKFLMAHLWKILSDLRICGGVGLKDFCSLNRATGEWWREVCQVFSRTARVRKAVAPRYFPGTEHERSDLGKVRREEKRNWSVRIAQIRFLGADSWQRRRKYPKSTPKTGDFEPKNQVV